MPQDDLKQNDNFSRYRKRERNEDGEPTRRGPRFNIYWVWGIIAAILVSINIFSPFSSNAKKISFLEFQQMLKNQDVDQITVISNKNIVRVYLKQEAIGKPDYKEKLKPAFGSPSEKGPHFEFNIEKPEVFSNEMTN